LSVNEVILYSMKINLQTKDLLAQRNTTEIKNSSKNDTELYFLW